MENIIEKIHKIDKKTMRNNILLGLIVTLGTGFYVYMNKSRSDVSEECEDKFRIGDMGSYYDDDDSDKPEQQKYIFEDLKQTLLNKLEETDKNNKIELKKIEDNIRTISDKLDKPQIISETKDTSSSLLDYIFPSNKKPDEKELEIKSDSDSEEMKIVEQKEKEMEAYKNVPEVNVPEVNGEKVDELKESNNFFNVPKVNGEKVDELKEYEEMKRTNELKEYEEMKRTNELKDYEEMKKAKDYLKRMEEEEQKQKEMELEEKKKNEEEEEKKSTEMIPEVLGNINVEINQQKEIEEKKEENNKLVGGKLKNINSIKSKKNKLKHENQVLRQILKKLSYTLKKQKRL